MQFDAFCRAHGVIVDRLEVGRWIRVPTVDHPRSRNGAYKYLGDRGYVQNWATMPEPALWRPEGDVKPIDLEKIRKQVEAEKRLRREGHSKAAKRAQEAVEKAKVTQHPYLEFKGFPEARGLVLDDELLVPMRNLRTNQLQGLQAIKWIPEERKYVKQMVPGMKAADAVFRLGPVSGRTWLVEGYATGLSVFQALRVICSPDSVLVTFSAGNLTRVAKQMTNVVAFADNDRSGAGKAAAEAAGIPYLMSDVEGEDANDMHRRVGVFRLAAFMRAAMGP